MLDKIQFAITIIYVVLTLAAFISLDKEEEIDKEPPYKIALLFALWGVAVGHIMCIALFTELGLI
mgnify:FL=1